MPSCLVCGRTSNSKNKDLGISFHQIPKNDKNRTQWLDFVQKCGVDHLKIKPKSIICSEHFSKYCFINYNHTKLLNESAVPSIIIERVKSAKIEIPEVSYTLGASNSVPYSVKSIIVKNDSIQIEGVETIDAVSVEEPSNTINQLSCEPSTSFLKKPLTQKVNSRFSNSEVLEETNNDSPRKKYLKLTISSLMRDNFNQRKKIKDLNQRLRRQKKQISSLKNVVQVLKNKNLVHEDQADTIDSNFSKHKDLIPTL